MERTIDKDDFKKRLDRIHELTSQCIGAACALVGLGFMAGIWVYWAFHKQLTSLEAFGAFGSYLQGAVGSLWSLAGILFIFAAFLSQRQQIVQQDAELEDQRRQFQMQHESIKRQNFESSFFQLLNLHNQVASDMQRTTFATTIGDTPPVEGHRTIVYEPKTSCGKVCFKRWYEELLNKYHTEKAKGGAFQQYTLKTASDFFIENQADLGHYFFNLHEIFDFIKSSHIEGEKRYFKLVAAQLSQYELLLLFYYGISPFGDEVKRFLGEFGLLHRLDMNLLLERIHVDFYTTSGAFQKLVA